MARHGRRHILDLETSGSGHIQDTEFWGDQARNIDDPSVWREAYTGRSESSENLAKELQRGRRLLRLRSAVSERLGRSGSVSLTKNESEAS